MSEYVKAYFAKDVLKDASAEYKQRRRKQMLFFYGAAVATFFSAHFVFRGIQTRRYIPSLFNANHRPLPSSPHSDAIAALTYSTMMTTSSIAWMVFGAGWIFDISSIGEFGQKMLNLFGNDQIEDGHNNNSQNDKEVDKATRNLEKSIGEFINAQISDQK
ncbi:altered inheritance of mitochondria protein 11 [Ascoidea rubescens DSM 1968]|uniref:Altered inheritance of mitochondria protein 11 n=1 Tax=Ascoidea rubescens DSM 1968 TaxID=1344418 RepID=A0A1D2VI61_9ASCO|nr:altered inheritance of mitochondria protein 11 [Ascoidea rubescens DSM 1968]ODV61295.1 altered inheritance of mitochondria protein 11 [Ascoidea rubescens DSM 1968]